MTLELLQFIRDYNTHLQGHQYQLIQVIRWNICYLLTILSTVLLFMVPFYNW